MCLLNQPRTHLKHLILEMPLDLKEARTKVMNKENQYYYDY